MKRLKHVKLLPFFLLIFLFTFSCSQDDEKENIDFLAQENFVELSLVNEIASGISFTTKIKSSNNKDVTITTKNVESIHEFKNEKGKTSFYVINYNEGGFVILSADKRAQPILAFSENNKFAIGDNYYPLGLKDWIKDAKKQITYIQNSTIEQSENDKLAWRQIGQAISNYKKTTKNEPMEECYEHTETYTKGPLLSSTWSQIGIFNLQMPFITCSGDSIRAYAGCGPIAMGQLMKYHNYPNNYNWASMPLDYATPTTANFIADIHDAFNNHDSDYPKYTCDGTNINSSDVDDILKTYFNYSSASRASFNSSVVEDNIDSNRPVILYGFDGDLGHMWVCDGYQRTTIYNDDCTGTGYLHFYMHWGWSGNFNGYFSYEHFHLDTYHFNNGRKMIYNIIP